MRATLYTLTRKQVKMERDLFLVIDLYFSEIGLACDMYNDERVTVVIVKMAYNKLICAELHTSKSKLKTLWHPT